jgi:hypothetical protein
MTSKVPCPLHAVCRCPIPRLRLQPARLVTPPPAVSVPRCTRNVLWRRSASRMRPNLVFSLRPPSLHRSRRRHLHFTRHLPTIFSRSVLHRSLLLLHPWSRVLLQFRLRPAVRCWASRQQCSFQRRAIASARELCVRTTRPPSDLAAALLHVLIRKCSGSTAEEQCRFSTAFASARMCSSAVTRSGTRLCILSCSRGRFDMRTGLRDPARQAHVSGPMLWLWSCCCA